MGGILVLFIYIKRLASNEIFSPSNKIHWEVGRAKDLISTPVMCPLRLPVGLACCLYSAQAILGVNEFGGLFHKEPLLLLLIQ